METDLELYRIFYTVATCSNISQAAEKLFISQPAVSKSIKKLEDMCGITLFFRNSRGVRLTDEGKVFFEHIEKALHEISVGEKILNRLKNLSVGSIKIGVTTTLCKHFLIPKLKGFIKKYPSIEIKIINKTTLETLSLIDEGNIDVGIVSLPFNSDEYIYENLGDMQDIFVAGKGYIETSNIKDPTNIASYSKLMLLEQDNMSRKHIDAYLERLQVSVKPDIEISNADLLMEFAKIDLGVTVTVKEFIGKELEEGSLIELPITPPIPKRSIMMISNKSLPLSIAAKTFWDYIVTSS